MPRPVRAHRPGRADPIAERNQYSSVLVAQFDPLPIVAQAAGEGSFDPRDSVCGFDSRRIPCDDHVLPGPEDRVRLEDVLDTIGKRAAAQVLEDGAVVIQLDEFKGFGLVGRMVHDLADDQGHGRLRCPKNRYADRGQQGRAVPPGSSHFYPVLSPVMVNHPSTASAGSL